MMRWAMNREQVLSEKFYWWNNKGGGRFSVLWLEDIGMYAIAKVHGLLLEDKKTISVRMLKELEKQKVKGKLALAYVACKDVFK